MLTARDVSRYNRRLHRHGLAIRTASPRWQAELGRHYLIDVHLNVVIQRHMTRDDVKLLLAEVRDEQS